MIPIVILILSLFADAPLPSGIGWMADNTVIVRFVSPEKVGPLCGNHNPDLIVAGCVDDIGGDVMTLPNPCFFADKEVYARIACHELAHTNYWRHEYK